MPPPHTPFTAATCAQGTSRAISLHTSLPPACAPSRCGQLQTDTSCRLASIWGAFCLALTPPVRLPSTPRLQPGENAASWMLDVGGGSAAGASKGPDFVELWKVWWWGSAAVCMFALAAEHARAQHPPRRPVTPLLPLPQGSELLAANRGAIEAASQPSAAAPSVGGGAYAASRWVQLQELLRRQATRYWRLPQYNGIRLVVSLAFALIVGSLYLGQGQVGGAQMAPALL